MTGTAGLLPNGKQQFLDQDGNPLASGRVFFYVPNTTTPKDTWQDASQGTLNSNPVLLDAAGEAIIYGSGTYRQVVQDVFGNTIWDENTQQFQNWDASLDQLSGIPIGAAGLEILSQSTPQEVMNYLEGVIYVTSLANLKALEGLQNPVVALQDSGGQDGLFIWSPADLSAEVTADTLQGIWVPPNSDSTGASGAWVRNFSGPWLVDWFGAVGDGTTDDSAAINGALATAGTLGGTVLFGPKAYACDSQVTGAVATGKTLGLQGLPGGSLLFPNGNGILVTLADQTCGFQAEGLTVLTGATNTGNGMEISQLTPLANSVNVAPIWLENLVFAGSDGFGATFGWAVGLELNQVSNVIGIGIEIWGPSGLTGNGVSIDGDATSGFLSQQIKLIGCNFRDLDKCILWNNYVSTLEVADCIFVGNYGVLVNDSITANILILTGCFLSANVEGINASSNLTELVVSGCKFKIIAAGAGIVASGAALQYATIVGNQFIGGTVTGTYGVSLGSGSGPILITGNMFVTLGLGVNFPVTSVIANVQSNQYINCTTNTSPSSSTGNVVIGGGSA